MNLTNKLCLQIKCDSCCGCLGVALNGGVKLVGVEVLVALLLVILVRHPATHLVPVHLTHTMRQPTQSCSPLLIPLQTKDCLKTKQQQAL